MLADDQFELPLGWKGAAFPAATTFGTRLFRPHPDGAVVLRCLQHGTNTAFGIWEAEAGKLIHFLPNAADACWTPDGKHLVTVDEAPTVTVLDWPALSVRREAQPGFDTAAGVGGLELAISRSGRLGALWIYSGQSEEGYVLFSLPQVVTLAALPYVPGESASPCVFSPDERYLVLVIEPRMFWWAAADDEADWDTPAKGGLMHWATLHAQKSGRHGARTEHRIVVDVPRGWFPRGKMAGATWPRNVRFAAAEELGFDLPWDGTHTLSFPPEGPCLVPGPAKLAASESD